MLTSLILQSAVVPLRLDRYEALSDLSKECSTLKFDLSSLQPDLDDVVVENDVTNSDFSGLVESLSLRFHEIKYHF